MHNLHLNLGCRVRTWKCHYRQNSKMLFLPCISISFGNLALLLQWFHSELYRVTKRNGRAEIGKNLCDCGTTRRETLGLNWEHLELFHSVFLLWAFIHRIPVGCFSCGFNRIHTAQQDEENKTWSPACQWLSGRKTQRIWKPSNESKFWKRLENWATPFPPSTRNELFTNNFIMLVYCSLVLNYYF